MLLLACLLIGIGVFYAKGLYERISSRWEEITFAYEKPQMVKVIRVDYEKKQAALEESFLTTDKSGEEKLLEAVAEQLKTNQSK